MKYNIDSNGVLLGRKKKSLY